MNEWLESIDGNRYIIHIGELIKLFLRYIWIIILTTLLFGGAAYAYSAYCITPLYQSSIKMYVNNSTNVSDATSITSSDIAASQYLVETYAVVLTSKPTINAVIEQTGVDYTYSQLCSMISTSAINDTEVFQVTVTGPDPIETAELANAIAEFAPEQIMDIVSGSSVKIVEYADIATHASSPNKSRYALMGAMLGFVLSCGCILLFSLLRNGMSVEEKVRRDFKDRAVLSVIPLMGKKAIGKRRNKDEEENADLCDQLKFSTSEAYKLLRENIFFCLSDIPDSKVIGVTSSVRSEGKTTTSINLAYTLAQANKKVCLIDCDFRLPAVAHSMNLRGKPGMTNLLFRIFFAPETYPLQSN